MSQLHRPGVFRSAAERQQFTDAYRTVLTRWSGVTFRELRTRYGSTRVNVSGPLDGIPVVALPGWRATSGVWYRLAAELTSVEAPVRLFAPDRVGDAGLSRHDGLVIESRDDLVDWLDETLDGLGLDAVSLVGHGYGGWLALSYALELPERVSRLLLVDPTDCFAPLSAQYQARSVPVVLRSDQSAARRLLAWESGGVFDPLWGELYVKAAMFPLSRPVWPRRPDRDTLSRLRVPTDLVVAGRSRAHDPRALVRGASLLPDVRVDVVDGVSHLTLPLAGADRLARLVAPSLV